MMRLFVLGVVLLTGLLSHSQALEVPTFVETPCPFLIWEPEVEGETIICGTVQVPESRRGLSNNVITLKVAILKTSAANPVAPIIYLEGGPGGSAITGVHGWLSSVLRSYGDIILFDQRGTGYSTPSLNCHEFDDDTISPSDDPEELCRRRLIREGVTLSAYTSAESAADIDALIRALGLPEVTLYGVSYGTRLALTTIRDYPERIRSVIIDSVYPPHVQGYEEQVVNGVLAFEVLFRDCAASRACSTAYPNLRQTFLQMIDDLNRRPMRGDDREEITGDDVVNALFSLMYETTALPYLPIIITAAANRDYDAYMLYSTYRSDDLAVQLEQMTDEEFDAYAAAFLSFADVESYLEYLSTLDDSELLELLETIYSTEPERSPAERAALDARLMELLGVSTTSELNAILRQLDEDEYNALIDEAYGLIDDDSEGFFNSVTCFEEMPFNSLRVAERLAADFPRSLANALLYDVERQFASCNIWDIEAGPALENEPVVSDIPVLVMSGEYDPITPPAWGQAAADFLPNSTHFVFPGMGHGLLDVVGKPCPNTIAVQFLLDPFSPLDGSCVAQMGPPAFFVE
ncbi:MAG: alpha/beta hydrolase [Anaerolineae bacterium]